MDSYRQLSERYDENASFVTAINDALIQVRRHSLGLPVSAGDLRDSSSRLAQLAAYLSAALASPEFYDSEDAPASIAGLITRLRERGSPDERENIAQRLRSAAENLAESKELRSDEFRVLDQTVLLLDDATAASFDRMMGA